MYMKFFIVDQAEAVAVMKKRRETVAALFEGFEHASCQIAAGAVAPEDMIDIFKAVGMQKPDPNILYLGELLSTILMLTGFMVAAKPQTAARENPVPAPVFES